MGWTLLEYSGVRVEVDRERGVIRPADARSAKRLGYEDVWRRPEPEETCQLRAVIEQQAYKRVGLPSWTPVLSEWEWMDRKGCLIFRYVEAIESGSLLADIKMAETAGMWSLRDLFAKSWREGKARLKTRRRVRS